MNMPVQPKGLGVVTAIDEVDASTLVGDLRDLILQEMRDAKDGLPWTERPEKAQAEMIDRADRFARNLVARAVNLIATGNNPSVPVSVKQWTVSDELKIQLSGAASHTSVTAMIDGGTIGFLVFAPKEPFQGEREAIQPAKDQPDLLDADAPVMDGKWAS
jgi:hypothetical protein